MAEILTFERIFDDGENETMSKLVNISDKDYTQWVKELCSRFHKSQIKAAVKVNREMLMFYWSLGRDIVAMSAESRWGDKLLQNLSNDLRRELPEATSFSVTNLRYMRNFYEMYFPLLEFAPQVEAQLENDIINPRIDEQFYSDKITPQIVAQLGVDIFSLPWGHHRIIIDKYLNNPKTALFYARESIKNGWSRSVLLNVIGTNLHLRQGNALTNFVTTLPEETSDLAREITKDPYNFAFTGITGRYNEQKLKDALLDNITNFLLELGSGFAYLGREYRLQIGETENFIDLLFYNLDLRCYVVIEVKTDKFSPRDIGQISTYVVACNHILRKEGLDNPTIGLLICKDKDNTIAQYALEGTTQPIGISEYELAKLYPQKVEGTIPTIAEIENSLNKEI